jgi:hypothetical protein
MHPKFIQIHPHEDGVIALDEDGHVWALQIGWVAWVPLPTARCDKAPVTNKE